MLFLFNDRIVSVDEPELHLARRWRVIGCGEPHGMRAREAIDFVRAVVEQAMSGDAGIDEPTLVDLAALVIAKTGANAIQFRPRAEGGTDPRLLSVEETVLEAFRASGDTGGLWVNAA